MKEFLQDSLFGWAVFVSMMPRHLWLLIVLAIAAILTIY